MASTIERDPFLLVRSMSAEDAKAFAMPNAFKVICCGQSTHARDKFGTRVYKLFASADDYNRYLANKRKRGGR